MAASARSATFVLGSASPRRLELLKQIGYTPDAVDPPHLDETPRPGELPGPHAARLAAEKNAAVATRHPDAFVLTADTVVACGRRILPKAETEEEARACLALLSGRRHTIHGGVAVRAPGGGTAERVVTTKVSFKRLSGQEIDAYLAAGEWRGKAGGYAIQGLAAVFADWINGSYSNVVGLPLYETAAMLSGLGLPPAWRR